MQTKRKAFGWQRRLWAMALAAVLACIPMVGIASAAPATGAVIVSDRATPKPTVAIVGNVVVDKGKPTGFYELSLRVKTARTITKDGEVIPEADYLKAMEEDPDSAGEYEIKNYPFQSAAAAVRINLDALTAVTWGTGKPVYSTWKAVNEIAGEYDYKRTGAGVIDYPRGIDLSLEEQPKIFTDLKLEKLVEGEIASVRLDVAHPDEMTNASALIEDYDPSTNTALLTLTASTTVTKNVVYGAETPVVVVRFAYDMNRFNKLEVGNPTADPVELNNSNFWLGLNRSDAVNGPASNQFPLTYLAEKGKSGDAYVDSDKAAAESSVYQTVWYTHNTVDDDMNQQETSFYYYLGADTFADQAPPRSYKIVDSNGDMDTLSLTVPKTAGKVVLANTDPEWAIDGDPDAAQKYSFFQNLLKRDENIVLRLVNAETYRKPTGGGGTTILFYDWDDSLIGSLVVDKGDVRAEVNEYVETNLVHPDLRASKLLNKGKVPEVGEANREEYANLVDSLARDYTYRGKYAYTVGDEDNVGPDGDTENKARTNGEDYPLTNKLDYAFYRRVNRIVEQEDANGAKTNYYSTSGLLAENNQDAALYPYVYGWAVVEDTTKTDNWKVMYDAAKTQDVWTTIGMGELSTVKPGAAGTPFPSGDPAIEDVTEPAFIAYETAKALKKDEDVAVPTTYQYTTASTDANKYFRFADFSDIDSELARYQKANGSNKDTLIVKAVYEPGNSLLQGEYKMIKEPYYNKMNEKSSGAGAAYSVEITMERANPLSGYIRGVQRTRAPIVRQDTTIDYKWLTDEMLNINHNLSNADVNTAKALTQTAFTKVDVDNGETITFTLSLSARQNKVNYFIVESYGRSFVTGGQRTETNFNQTGTAFVVDNYHYYSEKDSDTNDKYYNVKDYAEREGSHGFVLYGTLNDIMQIATKIDAGEAGNTEKNQNIGYLNLQDANLRDSSGTVAGPGNQARIQNSILAAAVECKTDHKNDPDYWNSELDCAELNYHQLQWYIIDGILRDRETADGLKLSFCHLHASCADLVSNKPKTWDDVIEAAAQSDADRLKQLSFDELKNLTYLRANANGGDFANVNVMINRIINAVDGDATMTDWVDVQKALLNGAGNVDTYWWYDGSTSNTSPGNWTALLDRAAPALTPQTYPDGVSRTTKSKLDSARSLFEANAAAGQNKATRQWITVTDNLVAAHREEQATVEVNGEEMKEWRYTYTPLTDFDDFTAKLVAAMSAADDFGIGYPSWEAVQYHLLFPDEPLDFINEPWGKVTLLNTDGWDPDADPPPKQWPEGFWWRSGNVPLTVDNIYTLLEAMKMLNGEDTDAQKRATEALKTVTWERLEGSGFWLRSSKIGEKWTEALEPDNKTGSLTSAEWQMFKDAQKNGAYNWNTLQYYLIHGNDPDVDVTTLFANMTKVNGETYYYWWRNGGTGTAINFSSADTLGKVIPLLFDASIRAGEFGDPAAGESVTEKMVDGSFYDLTHLTKSDLDTSQSAETLDDLTWFTATDDLLDKMNDLMKALQVKQGITDSYAPPTVDWYQAQHWLLTGTIINYGSADYKQAEKDYWWYSETSKPKKEEDAKNEEPSDPLAEAILVWCQSAQDKTAENDLKKVVTRVSMNTTYQIYRTNTGGTLAASGATATTQLNQAKTKLVNLAQAVLTSPYYEAESGKIRLYWSQIQYWYIEGTLVSNEDALRAIVNEWGWSKADGTGTYKIIPDQVDLSVLD